MPLMRDHRFVSDPFVKISHDDTIPEAGDIVIPLERFEDAAHRLDRATGRLGIHIANTTAPASLKQLFNSVDLISVAFPAFNDGRGFSIAKRLRSLGFTGILRATGPLIADQYAHAKACGFDELDIPETVAARQGEDQWKKGVSAISLGYQRGYHRPSTILDRRRAAQ